jgi:hypothetical protein
MLRPTDRKPLVEHIQMMAFVRADGMKLTRFRGHPNICVQGAHDGEDETTLHT